MRDRQPNEQGGRLIGLDYLRGFVIVMVVLHHSVLAYCGFGHFDARHYLWSSAPIVDSQRWVGFDIAVLFNDSYFMPLMFLLSGLFVGPSLRRKGRTAYLLDRLRRLGLPFALAVLTVMPLAYYPSYRMTGSQIGFGAFWVQTVFDGPWPAGPAWFVAVLFGFDVMAVAIRPRPWHRGVSFIALAALSLATYLPLLVAFGSARWFAWGPFAIQASRVLLYAGYFYAGVAIGPAIRVQGRRPVVLAAALFVLLLAVQSCRLHVPLLVPRIVWLVLYGVTVALFCAAATQAAVALFARFKRRFAVWDSLSANSYGIYLLHYPFVVWGQYALLDADIGALPKAAGVFTGALGLSWCSSAVLRRAVRSVTGFRRR
ncbi:acyltransferase [Acidisphaera sp. S103]|uniref:acyltransferase family protein n=1 Tax=Acidisphaera sp. S103 TaxID=1747223 RepID=UPI00131BA4D1|nr:acyltransferase [Acidisphaera sp. S103]